MHEGRALSRWRELDVRSWRFGVLDGESTLSGVGARITRGDSKEDFSELSPQGGICRDVWMLGVLGRGHSCNNQKQHHPLVKDRSMFALQLPFVKQGNLAWGC